MHKKSETHALLIFLIWLAGLGAAAQFGKIAVALDAFRARYDVSEVALGYLISSVGTVGLIFGVIGGALLSRLGIRNAMLAGLIGAGGLSLAQATLPGFGLMITLRLLEGACHLAIVIAGPILMARHSSLRARPAVMALWSSFFGVSYMLIALIAPPLIQTFGLATYLSGHGVYMLAMAAALWVSLPRASAHPPGTAPTHVDLRLRALLPLHRSIYLSPWLSAAALGFVCYTILYIALLAYLPGYAEEEDRTSLSATMPLISILISLTAGIWLLRHVAAVKAVQIGFALTAIAAPLLWITVGTAAFPMAAIVLLGLTGFVPGASFSALADLTQTDEDRALAMGALAQMGNVGTTCGPPLMAAIIAASGLSGVITYVLIFCGLGIAIHHIQAKRRDAI